MNFDFCITRVKGSRGGVLKTDCVGCGCLFSVLLRSELVYYHHHVNYVELCSSIMMFKGINVCGSIGTDVCAGCWFLICFNINSFHFVFGVFFSFYGLFWGLCLSCCLAVIGSLFVLLDFSRHDGPDTRCIQRLILLVSLLDRTKKKHSEHNRESSSSSNLAVNFDPTKLNK